MDTESRTTAECYGSVSVSGLARTVDSVNLSTTRTLRAELPRQFTPEIIGQIQKDFEGVANILREHPRESAKMFAAMLENRDARVRKMAKHLGMTEEAFGSKGGGLLGQLIVGAVVVVGVLIALEGEANGEGDDVPLFEDIDDIVDKPA